MQSSQASSLEMTSKTCASELSCQMSPLEQIGNRKKEIRAKNKKKTDFNWMNKCYDYEYLMAKKPPNLLHTTR